ncbi:MAG TPA: nicotinate-nucleotide--dimethylbenzimidazole phosphoribosyltransferase, partial [Rugosimonospora sp.]|nr:nicotinate-nucleotide--dimethylbenzimidazole phosphoribosyltransferase [Rugosimonospora sp.]
GAAEVGAGEVARRRAVRAVAAPVAGGFAGSETVTLGSGTELPASPEEPEINSRMSLPLPDETAAAVAGARLEKLDVPGAGLGNLAALVRFVAGTQGTATPQPYRAPRLMLVHGAHRGGLATADTDEAWQREVDRAAGGGGPLGILAGATGVPIQVVDVTAEPAEPIEESDATTLEKAEIGLRQGFRLAEAAVDTGTDLVILGAAGPGQVGAAAAVVSATVAVEPAAALPRVVLAGGRIDDNAWMARCEALRDGLRRAKGHTDSSVATIAALGGYDLAVATGIILGATFRRTPVMIDGPVGIAAGMLARDLGAQSRLWLLLADDGRNPAVVPTARVIGTRTFADLRLDLGEGAAALAVLPVIQHALLLSALSLADTEPDDSGDTAGGAGALTPAEPSSAW